MNIHTLVKNPDYLDLVVREKAVENDVALGRILAKARIDVIAGISRFGRIGQLPKGFIQSLQVMPALRASHRASANGQFPADHFWQHG